MSSNREPWSSCLAAVTDDATAESAVRRLQRFDAVTDLLAGTRRRLTVVVDDLQWADAASLQLIGHLAGEIRRLPLLLVVTTRPRDDQSSPEFVRCLTELTRQHTSTRIELGGLSAGDVASWLTHSIGHRVDPAMVASVHGRTNGNAFFVGEVAALIAAGASAETVPSAVHEVVRRHVSALPAETQQLLSTASVLGREFSLQLVGEITGGNAIDVLERFEAAIERGVLTESEHPGSLQFSHAIAADALSSEVGAARRARIHAKAASALHVLGALSDAVSVADLAHHAFLGMAAGTAELAAQALSAAARSAGERLADDDAAVLWGRAIEALRMSAPNDIERRVQLLIEQGRTYIRLDDIIRGAKAIETAIDLALGHDDVEAAAQAAIALDAGGVWQAGELSSVAGTVTRVLELVRTRLPLDSPQLPRVLGLMSDYGYWRHSTEQAHAIASEAIGLARATGDNVLLARTMRKALVGMWRSSLTDHRRMVADELLQLSDQLEPAERAAALLHAAGAAYTQGDVPTAGMLLDRVQRFAVGSLAIQTQASWFASCIALWRGKLDDAETLLQTGATLYGRGRRWGATELHGAVGAVIQTERDRLDAVREVADGIAESRYATGFASIMGFLLLELGDADRAVQLAHAVPPAADSWFSPAVDATALYNHIAFDDAPAVRELVTRLEPASGQLAAAGTASAFGDVDSALAAGYQYLGDTDRASAAIDRSIAQLTASQSGPWVVRALMRRATISGGDADLAVARSLADRHGLTLLQRQLAERSATPK